MHMADGWGRQLVVNPGIPACEVQTLYSNLQQPTAIYQGFKRLVACCLMLQAERDGLQKRLASTVKQHTDAASRAATAVQQVDLAGREQKRLAAEVERLSSVVHSHSVRLQK